MTNEDYCNNYWVCEILDQTVELAVRTARTSAGEVELFLKVPEEQFGTSAGVV